MGKSQGGGGGTDASMLRHQKLCVATIPAEGRFENLAYGHVTVGLGLDGWSLQDPKALLDMAPEWLRGESTVAGNAHSGPHVLDTQTSGERLLADPMMHFSIVYQLARAYI